MTYKIIMSVLLVLALGISPLSGQQCGPQGCTPATQPSWRASPSPVAKPATSPIPFSAVVRIHNTVSGRTSIGSGVYIEDGGDVFVLTCAHLFSEGSGQITVTYRNGTTAKATLLARDVMWDSAILKVPLAKGVTPAKLADTTPRVGVMLTSCGYGSTGQLRGNRGRLLRWAGPSENSNIRDWLVLSGTSRQGDSGGPVFNSRGRVAGVQWGGTDGDNAIYGSCVRRLRILIRSVAGKGTGRAVCSQSPQRPCPNNCTELRGQIQALQSQVAALEVALAAIQTTPGPVGPQGPRGLRGLQGEQGIQGLNGDRGDPGVSPIFSVDDVVSKVLQKLPKSPQVHSFKIVPRKQ